MDNIKNKKINKDKMSYIQNPIINATYAELETLVSNNDLIAGQQYLMTDFASIYDQPDYDSGGVVKVSVTTKTASTDPILLLAVSSNSFAKEVWRPSTPEHILEYDFSFNTTEYMGAAAKGRITYCKDEYNNETGYDHPNVLLKRYETINGSGIYDSYKDTGFGSVEVNTFIIFPNVCRNNKIGPYSATFLIPNNSFGESCDGNILGYGSASNVFGVGCDDNIFSTGADLNVFGNGCSRNIFGVNCNNNIFGNNCNSNIFGDSCSGNTFGTSCASNTFFVANQNHTFGTNCVRNNFLIPNNNGLNVGTNTEYVTIIDTSVSSLTTADDQTTFSVNNLSSGINRGGYVLSDTLTAAISNSSNSVYTTIWSFNVEANAIYEMRIVGLYQTVITTTGIKIKLGGTATCNVAGKLFGSVSSAAVATELVFPATTMTSELVTTGVNVANTPHSVGGNIIFRCTVAGTVLVTMASEVNTSAAQLNIGSTCIVERIN